MSTNLLISDDVEVVARWRGAFPEAKQFTSVRGAVSSVDFDAIVWLHLPADRFDAARLTGEAVRLLAPARIVALADTPSDDQALDLMERGAIGYCHAYAGAPMLHQVATVVGNEGLWVGPALLQRLIRANISSLPESSMEQLGKLSFREREVAAAVGRGASNKEIARDLLITERTVKAHMSAIFLKLGVRDRLQLVLMMRGKVTQ